MAVEDSILHRERVFYVDYADGTFKFGSGQELKVSRGFLAAESKIIGQLFRESSPENIIEIKDYDFDTFKLFLDGVMGFKECSVPETLVIFPIAWKLKTEKFIEKCLNILRPVQLNENVCLSLNVALLCECEELRQCIIFFLKSLYGIRARLFHEEKYYLLFEPEAVVELLKNKLIKLDSYNFKNVFKWGKNYITKNKKSMDSKMFFVENGIEQFLTADCFETKGSFYEFYKTEIGKNYFSFSDYEYVAENSKFLDGNSSWHIITVGDVLIEKIYIKNATFLENFETSVNVLRHKVNLYNLPRNKGNIFMKGEYYLKIIKLNNKIIRADEKRVVGSRNPERFKFVIKVDLNVNVISDLEIEIKRTFYCTGRISKMTPLNFEAIEPNDENTYFTKSVTFDYKELY